MAKPVIITCAPTGGIHTPTMSDHLPIGKSVPEDKIACHVEELRFPVEFPLAVFVRHRKDAEIHRSNIQRGHFRACTGGGTEPFLACHAKTAAGRDIDHRVGRLLDARQKLHEQVAIRKPGSRTPIPTCS